MKFLPGMERGDYGMDGRRVGSWWTRLRNRVACWFARRAYLSGYNEGFAAASRGYRPPYFVRGAS